MIKFTTFEPDESQSDFAVILNKGHLEKTAEHTPELKEFTNKLKPKSGKTYVLINALTSGEFYGSNRNGDFFPEVALKKFYKTFETYGHAYRHHQNKDPMKSSGKVVFSSYNPKMRRVELIVELDNVKAKDIIEKLEKGEYAATSMGVKTPADMCSICNKRSKKVSEYCDHLKYQMNKVLPDGRKVFAVNDLDLKFFDISFVIKPADATSAVMAKVASGSTPTTIELSAQLGEDFLKQSGLKESQLLKEVDGDIEAVSDDPKNLLRATRGEIPYENLKKIASKHSLQDILSTFLGLRIMPTPEEFQYIALHKANKGDLAEKAVQRRQFLMDLEEQPTFPIGVEFQNFNDDIAKELSLFVPSCSMTKPLIMRRILLSKYAEEFDPNVLPSQTMPNPGTIDLNPISPVKSPLLPMLGLGGLYVGFKELFNSPAAPGLEKMLSSKPWMIPLLIGAVAFGATQIQPSLFRKQASMTNPYFLERLLTTIPASYIYSGIQEDKARKGEQLDNVQELVRAHPTATALGTFWGTGKLIKLFQKHANVKNLDTYNEIVYNLTPERFEEVYKESLSL